MVHKKQIKGLRFKRWLIKLLLGRQIMYVIGIALYKSQKESEFIGNKIRAEYLGDIMQLFDTND